MGAKQVKEEETEAACRRETEACVAAENERAVIRDARLITQQAELLRNYAAQ